MADQYYTDDQFKLFCGVLDGLAFLLLTDLTAGMTFLKGCTPEGAESLVEYFDSTYVAGSFRRIQRPGPNQMIRIRFRRRPPTFAPELWKVHDLTLRNEDRTNNFCEAWNNEFSKIVGHSHPSVWRLLKCLKEDEAQTKIMLLENARGQLLKKRVYAE